MNISAIYLAAGRSRRMGSRKQEAELAPGIALASTALHALLQCSIEEVVVVVHPSDPLNWLPEELTKRSRQFRNQDAPAIRIVSCGHADNGMAYSLRSGLEAFRSGQVERQNEPDAVVVMLADQPFVDKTHIELLLDRFREQPGLDYVASILTDAEGGPSVLMPPVVLSNTMYAAVNELEGDAGARKLFANTRYRGEVISAETNAILLDVDNLADLELAVKLYRSI